MTKEDKMTYYDKMIQEVDQLPDQIIQDMLDDDLLKQKISY